MIPMYEITKPITHKLNITGIGVSYIRQDMAENIFSQLNDPKKTKIIISDPKTLTYYEKYKGEIQLLPLDEENKTIEDKIYTSGLSEEGRMRAREIIEQRQKEKKPITDGVLKNIFNFLK